VACRGQVIVTAGVHVLNPGQKVKFYVDPGRLGFGQRRSHRIHRVTIK
jgi:cold shock CspA family protein